MSPGEYAILFAYVLSGSDRPMFFFVLSPRRGGGPLTTDVATDELACYFFVETFSLGSAFIELFPVSGCEACWQVRQVGGGGVVY